MTISYPARVYTQKQNHWRFIPTIASTAAPKLSEWTAGIGISQSFDADQLQYTLSSEVGKAQRYGEATQTSTPGPKMLEAFEVEVYVDPQKPSDAGYALATAWKLEPVGFLGLRGGLGDSVAAAIGQFISPLIPIKVQSLGLVGPKPSDSTDVYKWKFKVLPTGDPIWDIALVTG